MHTLLTKTLQFLDKKFWKVKSQIFYGVGGT